MLLVMELVPDDCKCNHWRGCGLHRYAMQRGGNKNTAVVWRNWTHLRAVVENGCSRNGSTPITPTMKRSIQRIHCMLFTSGCDCSKRAFNDMIAYPTWLPLRTGAVTVVTTNLPSASTAERIIPCDSIPIILRGGKLAINNTCLPTSTDGSG